MGWWPFGSSQSTPDSSISSSSFDIPTPPALSPVVPPPPPPKNYRGGVSPPVEFTGFSPPPRIEQMETSESYKSSFLPRLSSADEYDNKDYSKYVSSIRESDGLRDDLYAKQPEGSSFTQNFTSASPRMRACFESVKMGTKMGAAVGGIFGTLTGIYASFVHRNVLLLPLSMAGGAISFGFFLGCGMIVRCDDKKS